MFAEQLIVTLDSGRAGRAKPYHRQVYEQLRQAVLDGRLQPGDRLPATRDLAARLGLARNTVARAYEDLLAEGYLSGRVGSGTYVAAGLAGELRRADRSGGREEGSPARRTLSAWGRRALGESAEARPGAGLPYDFRPGTPEWSAFPHALWLRLLGRAVRRGAEELTRYGDPAGHFPLREAIARHLALSRGVTADAERVVVVSGSQQALDLLARLMVGPGDAVALEDPGYPAARITFAAAGAALLPVPVDGEGLDVEELRRRAAGRSLRLLYVTPSHQFPTGATLSLARRLALLDWAARRDVLVVEDDYDSEFRYTGRPVESLQGLDRRGQVAYVGTFGTVLFPPLRVGYVVLPPDLVEPFVKAKWLADRQTPTLEQLALADFLAEGHFGRHLRRMRRLAAERRTALLRAMAEHLAGRVEQPLADTGMHVMLRLAARRTPGVAAAEVERAIVSRAAALGVGVYPLSPCCTEPQTYAGLLLGYAALASERIREGIRRLARAMAGVG